MSIFDTIQSDMYAAMKNGDKHKTGTLRVALSTLKDKKIEKSIWVKKFERVWKAEAAEKVNKS